MSQHDYAGSALQRFFENGNYCGEQRVYLCGASVNGKVFSAYWPHRAFFCRHCGEIWGRAVLEYEFAYEPKIPEPWIVEEQPCQKHGDGQFLNYFTDLTHCSEDILRREALLLLLRN